jgi:hypothetical protein
MLTRNDFKTAEIDLSAKRINGESATDRDLRLPMLLVLIEARNVAGPSVAKELEDFVGKSASRDGFSSMLDYVKSRCGKPANQVLKTAVQKSIP